MPRRVALNFFLYELVNFELRLAVLYCFANFQPHLFLNFEIIDVNFCDQVYKIAKFLKRCLLEECFLLLLQHRKIAKVKKRVFFNI